MLEEEYLNKLAYGLAREFFPRGDKAEAFANALVFAHDMKKFNLLNHDYAALIQNAEHLLHVLNRCRHGIDGKECAGCEGGL